MKGIIKREGIVFPDFPDSLDVPENERLNLHKVVILYRVRRSGKTYILYDLFKKYTDRALYLDFKDERLADFETKDFERLKEAFLKLKPCLAGANQDEAKEKEMIFLFDEIQNIKGWERFCRRITERENIKVFVSGSS